MKSRPVVGSRTWLVQPVLITVAALAVVTVPGASSVDAISNWNLIALQAAQTAGQGAIVQSRTLAIVQVAVHDALNAIDPRYERYVFKGDAPAGASVEAAIAAAARNALVGAIAVGAL